MTIVSLLSLTNFILQNKFARLYDSLPLKRFQRFLSMHQLILVAIVKIYELDFKLVLHSALFAKHGDFHLFSSLKKLLSGKKFSSTNEAIDNVDNYFKKLEKSFYQMVLVLHKCFRETLIKAVLK